MRVHLTTVRPLTADERRRLTYVESSAQSPWALRDAVILALLLESGLRASELCAITLEAVSDADDKRLAITVRGTKIRGRRLLLSPETSALVRDYVRRERNRRSSHEELLFYGDAIPLDVQGVHAIVRTAGERAGIAEPLTVHRLRQTALSDAWTASRKAQGAEEDR